MEVGLGPGAAAELYAVYRDGVKIGEIAEPRFEDEWLLAGKTYQYVVRAIGADGESADSPPARITTPPSRAFEIGPYLQELTATGASVVWQTYDPATTALSFGPAGGRSRSSRATRHSRGATTCRLGRSRRERRTSIAGSPTASWVTCALHYTARVAERLLLRRDRRLRHRHAGGACESAPPVRGPAPVLRDHDG